MNRYLNKYARKARYTVMLVSLTLSLSSCKAVPDFLSFGDNNLTLTKSEIATEAQSIVNTKPTQTTFTKTSQLTLELQEAVEQWKSLRPSITRLVQIENDLEYLLIQLSDASSTPLLEVDSDVAGSNFTPATKIDSDSAAPLAIDNASKPDFGVSNFSDVNDSPDAVLVNDLKSDEPVIELAKAPQIRHLKPTSYLQTGTSLAERDSLKFGQNQERGKTFLDLSKFTEGSANKGVGEEIRKNSSSNYTSAVNRNAYALAQKGASQSKFQSTSQTKSGRGREGQEERAGLCQNLPPSSAQKAGYAIHLASFKSEKLAQQSLIDFSRKYIDISCNKNLLIHKVVVKNIVYHSARLGPYSNLADAQDACRLVRSVQSYCAVTSNEGQAL